MCNYDLDPPEFFEAKEVRARRPHRCCECDETIEAGQTYTRNTGKWDGEVRTYAQCQRCARIAALHVKRHPRCDVAFGELLEEVREHQRGAAAVADLRRSRATAGQAARSDSEATGRERRTM